MAKESGLAKAIQIVKEEVELTKLKLLKRTMIKTLEHDVHYKDKHVEHIADRITEHIAYHS